MNHNDTPGRVPPRPGVLAFGAKQMSTLDAMNELTSILQSTEGRDLRKRRLLMCALTRRVLSVLTVGPVHDAVRTSIDFGESWADEEVEDAKLDERTRLIRSYDRRQILNTIWETIQNLTRARKVERLSRPSLELLALDAAQGPIASPEALLCSTLFHFVGYARLAIVCHERQMFDPDGRDPEVAQHAEACETELQLQIARDIFGDLRRLSLFDPPWVSETAVLVAREIYKSRNFSAMPILADALQDTGWEDEGILNHCRDPKQVHVRGCWVVDLVKQTQ
jgi:hypothetical protein